jgi:DNA-binding transcriptional regulator YiaG
MPLAILFDSPIVCRVLLGSEGVDLWQEAGCLLVRVESSYERIAMSTVKVVERVDPREIRRKLGLNQQQFWSKIGVTQSGGSRYESGRNMPKPVRELLRLVHVEQIDIQRLKREDFEVVEYLKAEDPEQFKSLKKAARGKVKKAV